MKHAELIDRQYRGRTFHHVGAFLGGQARLGEQLGLNTFAGDLLPLITKYFGNEADEARDEIISRAYVSSDELGRYGAVLETYLKDRVRQIAGSQIQPIVTGRQTATGLSTELQVFSTNPSFYGRVQLIIGAVGSGKSTFIERYYKNLLPQILKERTSWSFIDFNSLAPAQDNIQQWVALKFIESFQRSNQIDLDDIDVIEKVLSVEINKFEKGPAKLLKKDNFPEYTRQKVERINLIISSPVLYSQCIASHFGGERGRGIVVVFDNVDKRSRDLQLDIFEAAQWFKNLLNPW